MQKSLSHGPNVAKRHCASATALPICVKNKQDLDFVAQQLAALAMVEQMINIPPLKHWSGKQGFAREKERGLTRTVWKEKARSMTVGSLTQELVEQASDPS